MSPCSGEDVCPGVTRWPAVHVSCGGWALGCQREEVPALLVLNPSTSPGLSATRPPPCTPQSPAGPAPPPCRMEAMVSIINPQRREEEVTIPGRGAAGRAGSSLCPLGGLPAAWEDSEDAQGRACLPGWELSELGLRLHLRGLAQPRRATEMQGTNKQHS